MPPHLQNDMLGSSSNKNNNTQQLTSPRRDRSKLNVAPTTENNHTMLDISNDHQSLSGQTANSAATPSSVYMTIALSRDNMSDLSGVSGDRTHPGAQVVLDPKSLQGPWNQAYSLSNLPPENNHRTSFGSTTSSSPSIWVAQNDVVEIFDNLESITGLDLLARKHDRVPILVLLMDPSQQTYELMQIWVDLRHDSIRDLVQVLQHKLPSQWKQAYDGLFQVRGNRFTQLINIIKLVKYDIQPNEILIAKPWSMAAKVTIAIAGSAIRHLTRIGVIETEWNNDEGKGSKRHSNKRQQQQARNEDLPLLLSKCGQDRAYFPEGILDHHHATQFITFSPTFDDTAQFSASEPETPSGFTPLHSTKHNNQSFSKGDDAHSSLLTGNKSSSSGTSKKSPGLLTLGVRRVIARPRSRRRSTPTLPRRRKSNNNNQNNNSMDEKDSHSEEIQFLVDCSELDLESTAETREQQQQIHYYSDSTTTPACGPVGCFSKFNCLRNMNSVDDDTKRRDPEHNNTPHVSMATLSEEEEKRWLAYSMKRIDEDQSLANASVVSMSAPLLSPDTPLRLRTS